MKQASVCYLSPSSSDRSRHKSPPAQSRRRHPAVASIEPYRNARGHKIQARSLVVYNAVVPTRDQVRRENFARRHAQMACMGFRTPANMPYRNIGEPMLLDSRHFGLIDLQRVESPSSPSVQTKNPQRHQAQVDDHPS